VNPVTLLPFVVLIGAMFLMTRSAKRKQQQATQMRDQMQPGSGVRTIGGMYAIVKEIQDETVLLEVAPGTHAVYAKNAIGAILDDDEYNRIVHGAEESLDVDTPVVPDDASSLTADDESGAERVDLGKQDVPAQADAPAEAAEAKAAESAEAADAEDQDAPDAKVAAKAATAEADATTGADDAKPKKTDGESDAK
jgi:preprotein translocase subunit YajC